jgi:hypothetical protein
LAQINQSKLFHGSKVLRISNSLHNSVSVFDMFAIFADLWVENIAQTMLAEVLHWNYSVGFRQLVFRIAPKSPQLGYWVYLYTVDNSWFSKLLLANVKSLTHRSYEFLVFRYKKEKSLAEVLRHIFGLTYCPVGLIAVIYVWLVRLFFAFLDFFAAGGHFGRNFAVLLYVII